jgi:hypothetical protein
MVPIAEPTEDELMAWIPEFEKSLVGKKNGKLEFKVKTLRNRELLLALWCSLGYHCGQGSNGKCSLFEP